MPYFTYRKDGEIYRFDASSQEEADKMFESSIGTSSSVLPGKRGDFSYLAQGVPAAVEGVGRGLLDMGGQIWGGLAGALEGAVKGKPIAENAAKVAQETGKALTPSKRIFAPTEDVEKEILHPAFDWIRQQHGKAAETAARTSTNVFPPFSILDVGRRAFMTQEERGQQEAQARTSGEVLADVMGAAGIVQGAAAMVGRAKARLAERAKARDTADAAGEAKPTSTVDPIAESVLRDIDEQLNNFPDKVSAPQYGLGRSKLEMPPDNIGRAKVGDEGITAIDRTTLAREQRMLDDAAELSADPAMRDLRQVVNVQPVRERDPMSPQMELFPERAPEPPRGQMELPFDRDPRVLDMERRVAQGESMDYWNYQRMVEEQRARQERQANEQRAAEETSQRVVPSVEEAFRRVEEQRRMDAQADQARRQLLEQEATGREPPAGQAGPRVTPVAGERVEGNTRRLPPRSQRGAIMTEAITEGFSNLWNKVIHLEEKQQRVRDSLQRLGQTDRQAIDLVVGEKRTPDEFYRTLPEGKAQDFDLLRTTPWQRLSLPQKVKQALTKLPESVAREAAIFAADPGAVLKWTGNPVVKYVADKVRDIDAKWNTFSDVKKEGTRHIGEGFGSKKLVDPDSVSARREHLSTKEKNQVADLVNDLTAEPRALNKQELMAKGYGQKAIDLVEKMQKNLKDVLNEVNAALIKAGKTPIDDLPHYLMKYFGEGNFVTRIVDANGKSLWFQRTKTKDEGRALAEKFLGKMQEKGIEGKIENPKFQSQSELADKMNLAPGVIKDIENALGRSDPRIKVIQEIQKELRNEVRAGGHAARRKNVAGGEMDGKTVFKAYDRYIDQMSTYAKNVELSAFQKEFLDHPGAPAKDTVVRKWIDHYIESQRGENYQGGSGIAGFENFINDALGAHRIGGVRQATKYASRGFNKAAMLVLNPAFAVASWLQSTAFTVPGINTYARLNGMSGSAGKAMAKAYIDMASPSKDQRAFLNWEASRGSIDPTAIREWSSMNTRLDKVTNYALLEALPKSGEKFGRIHSSLAAYEFLYENGMRGKQLWQEAERISRDYVMGDYSTVGRPAIVRDTGFIGDAARPLSTFYNFYLNQVGVMMDLALRGKPGPLVQHYLMNTMLAGLIGSPFIGAVNQLWDALKANKWFQEAARKEGFNINENTGTASEWILQNLPDAAVFGPIDAAFGRRISGSMASPELHFPGDTKYGSYGSAAFPGWTYAYKTITSGINLLADQINPSMTRAEQIKALKDFMPGKMVDNLIENWDIITGERDTTSLGKRGAGEFRRTPEEGWANVIGGRTLEEERAKQADTKQFEREKSVSDTKTKLITRMADLIESGDENNPMYDRLLEKAIDLGIKPGQINKLVRDNLKDRQLTKQERDVGKGLTSQQRRRIVDQLLMEEATR